MHCRTIRFIPRVPGAPVFPWTPEPEFPLTWPYSLIRSPSLVNCFQAESVSSHTLTETEERTFESLHTSSRSETFEKTQSDYYRPLELHRIVVPTTGGHLTGKFYISIYYEISFICNTFE